MARIQESDLNSVFYLYPSVEDANAGRAIGGCGFWVAIQSTRLPGFAWIYAVSNRHVVHKQGASVIRANGTSGGFFNIDADPVEWIEHPKGHDVAVYPLNAAEVIPKIHYSVITDNLFITKDDLAQHRVGVGDDAYLIGRFINHEGKARNTPSARFGNISMLPSEPIYIDAKTPPQESFAVELRSMCGYSGSPVFVSSSGVQRRGTSLSITSGQPDKLLGVQWGYLVETIDVETRIIKTVAQTVVEPGEREVNQVSANTGMNGVVPAWRLMEVLDLPQLKNARTSEEDREITRIRSEAPTAKLTAASEDGPPATGVNPTHREDFTRLLGAAAQKPRQED